MAPLGLTGCVVASIGRRHQTDGVQAYQGGDPVAGTERADLLAAADRAARRGADRGVLMLEEVRGGPYGDETTSLRPLKMIGHFTPRLIGRFFYRIFMNYFMRDFNAVSVFLTAGIPALAFGVVWSLYRWIHSYSEAVRTGTGTIMIGALAILIGFQLILQATVLDVENEPGRGGREPHRPRRKPASKPD